MAHFASWIILGLFAGALARWILPGQERGGWISALVLGILGALLGGWIAHYVGILESPKAGEWIPNLPSVVTATLGSIILLIMWKWIRR